MVNATSMDASLTINLKAKPMAQLGCCLWKLLHKHNAPLKPSSGAESLFNDTLLFSFPLQNTITIKLSPTKPILQLHNWNITPQLLPIKQFGFNFKIDRLRSH